jgi:hypothetical protein
VTAAAPETPAVTPGQADEPLTLHAQVTQIAAGLKREADLIEADPHLNPLIRPAIAEAYRTAAGRIDIALSDDSRRPVRTVRDGISQALANLRRMGDACAPSRAAKVRAALAECERAVREAYGEPA